MGKQEELEHRYGITPLGKDAGEFVEGPIKTTEMNHESALERVR